MNKKTNYLKKSDAPKLEVKASILDGLPTGVRLILEDSAKHIREHHDEPDITAESLAMVILTYRAENCVSIFLEQRRWPFPSDSNKK